MVTTVKIESGGYYGDRFWSPSITTANKTAENAWQKIAPVKNGSPRDILEATHPGIGFGSKKTDFGPIVDGYVIPEAPGTFRDNNGLLGKLCRRRRSK